MGVILEAFRFLCKESLLDSMIVFSLDTIIENLFKKNLIAYFWENFKERLEVEGEAGVEVDEVENYKFK